MEELGKARTDGPTCLTEPDDDAIQSPPRRHMGRRSVAKKDWADL